MAISTRRSDERDPRNGGAGIGCAGGGDKDDHERAIQDDDSRSGSTGNRPGLQQPMRGGSESGQLRSCHQDCKPGAPVRSETRNRLHNPRRLRRQAITSARSRLRRGHTARSYLTSARYNRADVFEQKDQYDRALADYDEIIRIHPADARAWNNRCWTRTIVGQLEAALADCNESLRLNPRSANALDSRGLAYLKLGDLDRSVVDYDAALQIDPRLATSLYGRGLAKLKSGDRADADADIAAAAAIKPNIAEEFVRYGLR